ncbi:MAG TPA: glycosyltransferase family 4 protein [Gemmatimonadaceae bacterium]|nr:glycosyltransferase family 4 protein [Gemmatimonadaceae bacterium]
MARTRPHHLRVLHFIYDDPSNPWVGGGGAVRVRELYKRLRGRVDVTVVTGRFPGAKDAIIDGIPYIRIGADRPYAWSRLTYARAANAMIREAEYDAALFDFSGYTPLFLPKGRPTGVILHHLTAPTARARWGSVLTRALARIERAMIRRASYVSATSLSSREAARRIAPDTPLDMVGAGVPEELFRLERRPSDFLLYFGRLDVFHKGIDTLLEAVAIIARSRPEIELRIAGRGSSVERIRSMIDELRLNGNVRLLGAVSDAKRNELLSTACVQLMPSRFEGFGLAAAEAMAAGVPLVAAAVGSLPEVVDAPRGGVLVPSGDATALAAAVERLLDDPGARAALSQSARQSARRFSWDAVAEAHLQFIAHVAGRPSPPPGRANQ